MPEERPGYFVVTAVDDDSTDSVTGYAITGGADQARFLIKNDGRLSMYFTTSYENPIDADDSNTYEVNITATSGTGSRMKTATQAVTVTVNTCALRTDRTATCWGDDYGGGGGGGGHRTRGNLHRHHRRQ